MLKFKIKQLSKELKYYPVVSLNDIFYCFIAQFLRLNTFNLTNITSVRNIISNMTARSQQNKTKH